MEHTALGHEVAEELDAYTWAQNLLPQLPDSVFASDDFEIHKYVQGHLLFLLDADMQRSIDRTAYDRGYPTHAVRSVLYIVLRDAIISKV